MKTLSLFFIVVMLTAARVMAGGLQTQTFVLQPGWNAIYLEVRPTNSSVNVIFNGVPIDSLWTFSRRLSSVEFIADPNEPVWNRDSWLLHVPTNRVESFQNNLFHLLPNRAYLVKLAGGAPVTVNITGTPTLRQPEWVPEAYNLRGFPVDPNSPPTFGNFFRPSPAHFDSAANQLRGVYHLNSSGQWALVSSSDLLKRDEAYWVFCQGPSVYTAPLQVSAAASDGLEFGVDLSETTLSLHNQTTAGINVALLDVSVIDPVTPAASLLSYFQSVLSGSPWTPLPAGLMIALAAGERKDLRLAVRRGEFPALRHETVLHVQDGAGVRYLVPVSADRLSDDGGVGLLSARSGRRSPIARLSVGRHGPAEEAATRYGLWVGTATINAVSESHSGTLVTNVNDPANLVTRTGVSPTPTPTKSEFNLRMLIHVGTNGQARLLKDVIQMWQDGTYTNNAVGERVMDKPGRYVLITDDTLIPQFQGATIKDGRPVGRRISTVSFDFPSTSTNNFLNLDGFFAVGTSLTGSISIPSQHVTNPFKHRYHPDHDNLDGLYVNFREEAQPITRALQLDFTATDPSGNTGPEYGYSTLGGNYLETVTGLHRTDIVISGTFRLSRISDTGVLNQ